MIRYHVTVYCRDGSFHGWTKDYEDWADAVNDAAARHGHNSRIDAIRAAPGTPIPAQRTRAPQWGSSGSHP